MSSYKSLITQLQGMRTGLAHKLATKQEPPTPEEVRDLAALHIAIEAVEGEEMHESFDTPLVPPLTDTRG
jgi:hypothetical protein